MPNILIIAGSSSDLRYVGEGKVMEAKAAMEAAGGTVKVVVGSAHRNAKKLMVTCPGLIHDENIDVVICIAGMAAALPGFVAAALEFKTPVIGVPLPSAGFEDCKDALLAMFRMPPGAPVMVANGVYNAMLSAWQIVMVTSSPLRAAYDAFMKANAKPIIENVTDDELRKAAAPKGA